MRHLTRQTDARYRSRDNTLETHPHGFPQSTAAARLLQGPRLRLAGERLTLSTLGVENFVRPAKRLGRNDEVSRGGVKSS
jgi:hypothetical protein